MGDLCESIANILSGISTILAFSAGFFGNEILSFVAGCCGTCSLVFLHFSSYAMRESKERTQQVNIILTKLGLDKIPDISIDSSSDINSKRINDRIQSNSLDGTKHLEQIESLSHDDPSLLDVV